MAEHPVVSPLPGVFYRRPNPQADPYVVEGQRVHRGDTVGLVEVMKTFHEIKSDVEGVLLRFLVENEGAVQPGQAIALIETDS